jgi:hypothetical protein
MNQGEKKPFVYLDARFTEGDTALSPDSEWIAYSSDASKRSEIYIFIAPDHKLMEIQIDGGSKLVFGSPHPLFETRLPPNGRYDATKNERSLIPTQIESTGTVPMTLLVNWTEDMKMRGRGNFEKSSISG